jgi:hypothetical protein
MSFSHHVYGDECQKGGGGRGVYLFVFFKICMDTPDFSFDFCLVFRLL